MSRGRGKSPDPPLTREDRIAQVAHEAVALWRRLRGEAHVSWGRAGDEHRQHYAAHVRAVIAGADVKTLHAHRAAAGLVDTGQDRAAQLKETALVHATATALGCGQERWDVKTGTDPDAASVNMTSRLSTIAELVALPAPPADPPARVPGGPEFQVYTIEATITEAKIEADSDYHLALSDGQGNTMIAESACPGCASGSPWLPQIQAVRAAVDAALPGLGPSYQPVNRTATLTGVGFYDRKHGQAGVAGNGIELHPLLAITFD